MTDSSGRKKRCVVVMYDTLCRHFMPTYGNEWVKAPNFDRLAKRSVPEFLCRVYAVYAGEARDAHWQVQLPASVLGPIGAIR